MIIGHVITSLSYIINAYFQVNFFFWLRCRQTIKKYGSYSNCLLRYGINIALILFTVDNLIIQLILGGF
jgi:hypothetical protein